MVKFFFFFLYFLMRLHGDYSIVFVHVGQYLPEYAHIALDQAREFNPDCPIILLASAEAIEEISLQKQKSDITYIPYESLQKTGEHLAFEKTTVLDARDRQGFWRYTSERFLYLNDFMEQYALKNVFHLEYDNMLYVNLEELLPCFCTHYPGIGAVFDNDDRCIPGFVFIENPQAMSSLARCFVDYANKGLNDMQVIAKFKEGDQGFLIKQLPIIPKEYAGVYRLKARNGLKAQKPEKYFQHID